MNLSPAARASLGRCLTALVPLLLLLRVPSAESQWAHLAVSLDTLIARAARDSLDPGAQYGLGVGYWAQGRWDDADHALRRAVAIEPKTAAAYLALSLLPYARRPRLWEEVARHRVPDDMKPVVEESDRFYHRAFMIDPMVDLQVYGLLLPPIGRMEGGRAASAFMQGFQGFFGGQYESAFLGFDDLINLIPAKERVKHPPLVLLWYHGLAAAHSGRYGVAATDFHVILDAALAREKSDSVVPSATLASTEIRYVLAAFEQEAGQRDSALAHFQDVLTTQLGNYMAHARMANIYEFRHQWDLAIEERHRAMITNPDDPSLLYDLGVTLARAQRLPEARDALASAENLNPLNARVPYMLGEVELAMHDDAAARESLSRFVSLAPSLFHQQIDEARQQLAVLH